MWKSRPWLATSLFSLVLGLGVGWALPRGVQSGEALILLVLAGAVAGRCLRGLAPERRRCVTLALVLAVAVAASALVRARTGLPSAQWRVDRLLAGSTFAIGAVVLGQLVDLLLLSVAVVVGFWAKSHRGTALAAVTVAVTMAVGLVPAATPATTGGVAGVESLVVAGCRHRVVVRGREGGPVIVFLSGGPGGSEVGTLARQWSEVERDFTVVLWDQTGAGLNARCFPRDGRLRLDALRADVATVLQWAGGRFGRKPLLVANSWGTFLGTLVVVDHPELVAGYVGSGQMVDLAATDRLFHADTVAWAEASRRDDVAARLVAQGEPPYPTIWPYEEVFAHEGDWNDWGRDPVVSAAVNPLANVMDRPELDPVAKARYASNIIDSFGALYPTVQGIDLRREAASLAVPVYLAQGVHEARGRQQLARAWFEGLAAPHKEWVEFAASGHKAFGEEPAEFAALLRRVAAEAGA